MSRLVKNAAVVSVLLIVIAILGRQLRIHPAVLLMAVFFSGTVVAMFSRTFGTLDTTVIVGMMAFTTGYATRIGWVFWVLAALGGVYLWMAASFVEKIPKRSWTGAILLLEFVIVFGFTVLFLPTVMTT